MERVLVKNFTLPELEAWVERIVERKFRARQLFRHLYARGGVRSWDECSDLSKVFRTQLELGAELNALSIIDKQEASDGTTKYLLRLSDGLRIESVLIPNSPHYTLCVSSQVGCPLGCKFCLTGKLGFKRNLDTAEIIDQICTIQAEAGAEKHIRNLVLMGMGEPLANYEAVVRAINVMIDQNGLAFSHRRITLSTAGLVDQLYRLGKDSPVNLAISLHAPDDGLRSELMPVNRKYPLASLMAACRQYPLPPRKRITFEYILIDGVNDDPKQARSLVRLLNGVKAKVNLIPFNPHPDCSYKAPSEARILTFQEVLQKARLTTIIRQSRGGEISAACGQLAAKSGESNSAVFKEEIDIET
jgi:23S rRNA (adenine2503-C2)-methyltransferase